MMPVELEIDPWAHLAEGFDAEDDLLGLGAEKGSSTVDGLTDHTILTNLRPRSSSRSTFMNSHDIRTPPHHIEEIM